MKPNIVVYLTDQQRYDTLDVAGVFEDVTPNIDKLCDEGACFHNCVSVNPVCGPARACIQSGRYATQTGNYKNGRLLPPDPDLLANRLKDGGYSTAYIGKWHLYGKTRLLNYPFSYDVPLKYRGGYDYWKASNALEFTSEPYGGYLFDEKNRKIEFKEYRVDFITGLALEYLKSAQKSEKPYFLFISQLEPHQQNNKNRFFAKKGSREKFENCAIPEDLKGKDGDYKEYLPDYLGACHDLDESVGKIVGYLKDSGQWDNTVFIYSADHGCHFKTRNTEYKRSCHDASVRVPLVITGGAFKNVGNQNETVSILDIPATILSVADLDIPSVYEGKALDKVVSGEIPPEKSAFIQISESQVGRAVRTQKYKFCVTGGSVLDAFTKDGLDVYYEQYLYDLESDPAENVNLINDKRYQTDKEQLIRLLIEYVKKVENKKITIKPSEENPKQAKKYSFDMSLAQMKKDEKVVEVIKKYFPALLKYKILQLAINMPFEFMAMYGLKVPIINKKFKKFKAELEKLNNLAEL